MSLCYLLGTQDTNWQEAQDFCGRHNGYIFAPSNRRVSDDAFSAVQEMQEAQGELHNRDDLNR